MLADDVVRDPKDDELDRSGFASTLGHAILTMDIDSPFVFSIGAIGDLASRPSSTDWGSKTVRGSAVHAPIAV